MLIRYYSSSGIIAILVLIINYSHLSLSTRSYDDFKNTYEMLRTSENRYSFAFWGFFLPGILVALQGLYLKQSVKYGGVRWLPIGAFILSGLFFALSGFGVIFSNAQTFLTIGMMGNFFFFLVAGLTISDQLKEDDRWRFTYWKQIILVWLAVILIILRGIESIDGLAQKLHILTYFLWVTLFSLKAVKLQVSNLEIKADR